MREVAKKTVRRLSHDTVHRVLTRPEVPKWTSLESVVGALGGDVNHFRDLWVAARLAAEAPSTPEPRSGLAWEEARDGSPSQADHPDAVVPPRDDALGSSIRQSAHAQSVTAQDAAPIRVMVVDPHPMWRDAVARDLRDAGFEVVGALSDGLRAVRHARVTSPDVVVLELNLPGLPGAEVCRELMSTGSGRVLVLSASGETADVLAAIKSGANGYLVKSASSEELLDAVRRTAIGDPIFTPGLAGMVLGEYRRLATESESADQREMAVPHLTEREIEVLRLVAKGLSYRQIAERLVISHRTVQNHVQSAMGKLQLHSRVELVRYAIQRGLDDH